MMLMQNRGNLGPAERWVSLLSGLGLTAVSLTRGGLLSRGLSAAAGLSLLARGAAGHCGMKAALTGQSSLREGFRQEWDRMRSGMRSGFAGGGGAARIENLEALYVAELHELHSAESQLCSTLEQLPDSLPNLALERQLRGYATELRTRREDLARILSSQGANPREHPDQGMQALLRETRKMAQVCATNVRSAALLASIQRLIHYKIAAYGTVATYAQTLGRTEEAARLAEYADRDKAVDQELTSIAKELVNPQARVQPEVEAGAAAAARPH